MTKLVRKFGGRLYRRLRADYGTKSEATKVASQHRRAGQRARVVKSKAGYVVYLEGV